MASNGQIQEILKRGILAPSADNLQPWLFQIQGDVVDFHIDKDRAKYFCDEGLLIPYLSAGAVLQNIRVSASQLGISLSITHFPNSSDAYWFARVRFSAGRSQLHPHFEALSSRETNRRFYQAGGAIRESSLNKIADAIQYDSGFKLAWLRRTDDQFGELSKIIGDADQIRFEAQRLHHDLMEVMRFSEKESIENKDGLDIKSLEAGPCGSVMFRMMKSWETTRLLNGIGLSRSFNYYARAQMRSSQAAGVILAPDWSRESFVRGGEAMQKIWHEATLEGLAMQPMEALPIFMVSLNQTGGKDFTAGQKKKLQILKEKFYSLFGIQDKNGIILFFRVGIAKKPSARSKRRPLESFIVS